MSTTNTTSQDETKTKPERVTWEEIKNHPTKRIIDYVGPTGIWLLVYYALSLFIMVIMNIARIGWSFEAIFAAPSYFAQIFISYGLNAGKVEADPLDTELDFYYQKVDSSNFMVSAAWLFAPMVIYVLGIFMSILTGSGFQQPIGSFDYLTNFQYFHQFVPFLYTRYNDAGAPQKAGGFYFLIAWLPIILATLIAAVIVKRVFKGKRKSRTINVLKMMGFNLLAGFAVGIQMGVITGDVNFRILGAIQSILRGDYENTGYFFTGEYHPNTIMITSWFINFIPMFSAAIWFMLYDNLEDQILKAFKKNGQIAAEQYEEIEKKEA